MFVKHNNLSYEDQRNDAQVAAMLASGLRAGAASRFSSIVSGSNALPNESSYRIWLRGNGNLPALQKQNVGRNIGDCPRQNEKENVETASTIITPHTARWVERKGLNKDTIRVLSLNHWELDDLKKRKKLKTSDEMDQYVDGGSLMTADKIIELVEKKEKMKRVQLAEKKRRKEEKERRSLLVAQAKVEAAAAGVAREQHKSLTRELKNPKQKQINERKLMRLEDHRKLRRLVQNIAGKRRVPEPEPSFWALK
ncbi:unnamed protein product [Phytophthora fragariaefolia]|uniref:Unnamed protein product n=1 Tax=Phytophthora fragariaefolia TaxID=1490495 RepID=A0A9W6X5D0_9STRA|nr:unnamed protein product [Phytophthora fragariaefolia]